ncbi:DUF4846 domain-containing protein [Leptospira sp. 96542]|nr:DUF4846 domain-containing protein [Leptospira sp. 96542]
MRFSFPLVILCLVLLPLKGDTIQTRILPPNGYNRVKTEVNSFAEYLKSFPLKPEGSPVLLFNGNTKQNQVHEAVFQFPLLNRDLIQCADAIIKLRAEYFFQKKEYSKIKFKITNGMEVPFSKFAEGYRISVNGNQTKWILKNINKGYTRKNFDDYLVFIYAYAGTSSFQKELSKREISKIQIGDVFIEAGFPGHAVLVVDLVENKFGEKLMLIAQSYMPSQEMHILKNDSPHSPWFEIPKGEFQSPEWTFPKGSLRKFLD